MTRPKVLVVADTRAWAWARKAAAYQRWLSTDFDIDVAYSTEGIPDPQDYALVHCFEVLQLGILSHIPRSLRSFKVVAGLTAEVWRTWGVERMQRWAEQCDAMHGNSVRIESDLHQFHARTYYTPNGVEPDTFRRTAPHPAVVTFGHGGKPNPRKGGSLIIEAARRAGVPLLVNQRTSKLALSQAAMVDWYQGITVQVTASSMDGTPNYALESAATECAQLATPIGNIPEFLRDGVSGYLLPPLPGREEGRAPLPADAVAVDQLIETIADRMRQMAGNRVRTLDMGRAARATVERDWTWERQVRHVARMWTEVLG
jgi:hypothetical protein